MFRETSACTSIARPLCPEPSVQQPGVVRDAPLSRGGVVRDAPCLALAGMIVAVPIHQIDADPDQPRRLFDPVSLGQLAASLMRYGQLQPITVRAGGEPGRYTIVCGERRWRAAALAGLDSVKALMDVEPNGARSTGESSRLVERQLVENIQRKDLSLLEQARAYRQLMETHDLSARQLAQSLHLHHTTVTRAVALLDLPEDLLHEVEAGRLTPRAARAAASRATGPPSVAGEPSPCPYADAYETKPSGEVLVTRRVFATTGGRVVVELDEPGDGTALVNAVLQAMHMLSDDIRESREAESA